jgi:hypothetical protein
MLQRFNCSRTRWFLSIAFLSALTLFQEVKTAYPNSLVGEAIKQKRILHYSMSGRVRLLLFWVGRDNVGQGRVSIEQSVITDVSKLAGIITVLFGTIPERVPWRINRWGYGEEIGYWSLDKAAPETILDYSTFTGFMRHSPEEFISQVASSSRLKDQSQAKFWYDGITSSVKRESAQTEIFYFPLVEEVTTQLSLLVSG